MYLNRNKACQILKLNPFSDHSEDDIKRAYKKMAMEVHPDKAPNASKDEFVQVRMARDFLLNNNQNMFSLHLCSEIVDKAIEAIRRFMKKKMEPKCEDECGSSEDEFFDSESQATYDIHLKLDVTMSELYCEKGKKVTFRYIDNRGDLSVRTVYVSFVDYHLKRAYPGFGDWNVNDESFGDLTIELRIRHEKAYIINTCIDKLDLIRSIPISIYDYYYGFDTELRHFNEVINIRHNPSIDGVDAVFSQKGLQGKCGRGDLYVLFEVDFKHCVRDKMCKDTISTFFPSLIK